MHNIIFKKNETEVFFFAKFKNKIRHNTDEKIQLCISHKLLTSFLHKEDRLAFELSEYLDVQLFTDPLI